MARVVIAQRRIQTGIQTRFLQSIVWECNNEVEVMYLLLVYLS